MRASPSGEVQVVVVGSADVDIAGRSTSVLQLGISNPGMVRMSGGGVGQNIAENPARLGAAATELTLRTPGSVVSTLSLEL